jgi:hypothetical protein
VLVNNFGIGINKYDFVVVMHGPPDGILINMQIS